MVSDDEEKTVTSNVCDRGKLFKPPLGLVLTEYTSHDKKEKPKHYKMLDPDWMFSSAGALLIANIRDTLPILRMLVVLCSGTRTTVPHKPELPK